MKKSFAAILLLSLIAGCEESRVTSGTAELTIITIGYTTVEIFDTVGYTALEMLQKNHEVKSEFSFAVRCIDGVCSEGGYWWPLRVNGEKASVGPQSYIVEDKDKIEFVLSKK